MSSTQKEINERGRAAISRIHRLAVNKSAKDLAQEILDRVTALLVIHNLIKARAIYLLSETHINSPEKRFEQGIAALETIVSDMQDMKQVLSIFREMNLDFPDPDPEDVSLVFETSDEFQDPDLSSAFVNYVRLGD